jgi:hypothetical protein
MTSTRKNYAKKLKANERVKNGKSKASLFLECGTLEGTLHFWMKVEDIKCACRFHR